MDGHGRHLFNLIEHSNVFRKYPFGTGMRAALRATKKNMRSYQQEQYNRNKTKYARWMRLVDELSPPNQFLDVRIDVRGVPIIWCSLHKIAENLFGLDIHFHKNDRSVYEDGRILLFRITNKKIRFHSGFYNSNVLRRDHACAFDRMILNIILDIEFGQRPRSRIISKVIDLRTMPIDRLVRLIKAYKRMIRTRQTYTIPGRQINTRRRVLPFLKIARVRKAT